jgi:hypothetical protein
VPRPLGVALLTATVAGLLSYMVVAVPVAAPPLPNGRVLLFCPLAAPPLPRAQIVQYWPAALIGVLLVLSVDAIVLAATVRRRRRRDTGPAPASLDAGPPSASLDARPPPALESAPIASSPLRLERVPLRVAALTAVASLILLVAGVMQGYAMWIPVGLAVLPWIPLLVLETAWKYEHYGFWAIFGVVVLLQIGHMGEHTVQVTQLMLYHGRLAQSHGIFGQLDFETVHFFWDSAIWVIVAVMVTRFGRHNRWLWVAFAAASLHEVEHLYLYWMYLAHPGFYAHGGFEGIMGNGGLIGSPLARPYLHFAYNFVVVLPLVLAFWDQTKHLCARRRPPSVRARIERRRLATALPGS